MLREGEGEEEAPSVVSFIRRNPDLAWLLPIGDAETEE